MVPPASLLEPAPQLIEPAPSRPYGDAAAQRLHRATNGDSAARSAETIAMYASLGRGAVARIRCVVWARAGRVYRCAQDADGRIATAGGGSLLLDDLHTLDLGVPKQVLQVVDRGSYSPVGSDRVLTVAWRLLALRPGGTSACADRPGGVD